MKFYDPEGQAARRDLWMSTVRNNIDKCFNPDGSGAITQFNPTWREPLWILPALYMGQQEHIDLANRVLVRYNDPETTCTTDIDGTCGRRFAIFQSNITASLRHIYGHLMTEEAKEAADWHCRALSRTFNGSGQPDYKFHGANDNMPTMATFGLIFSGESLGIPEAVDQGLWNLQEVRRLLSRSAWMSEFNSSTYSPITLSGFARLAAHAKTPEVRELALDIEKRLWAELLLHYHPATFMQAGPHCRAYTIDRAGHTHTLQIAFWLAFGELAGRDPIRTYFNPDGKEVLHFCGNPWQSIAEMCDALDTEFHVPEDLAHLITKRKYPAVLRGRSECMGRYDGLSGVYNTETYMEEDFSLGTVNSPLCGGEQTTTSYVTYKRKPEVNDFRDSGTVYFKYLVSDEPPVQYEESADGAYCGEKYVSNRGWWYSTQKENNAALLLTPNLNDVKEFGLPPSSDKDTDESGLVSRKLCLYLYFPAHYGKINRTIMGDGPVQDGAKGESVEVVPVSIETGEVFIHVQPLLPTNLPRKAALRFSTVDNYELLELINYEGEERLFSLEEAQLILNGMVMTVASRSKYDSLEAFHQEMSDVMIRDYYAVKHRFFTFHRKDVTFEITYTPYPFGVQTEAVDGRSVPRPVFDSNQLDVNKLPFVAGPVPPPRPFFRWTTMEIDKYPGQNSIIGSRGLGDEAPYSQRAELMFINKIEQE